MIRYFNELDNKNSYYLPLINVTLNGEKNLYDYKIPASFIYEYSDIFKLSESLINIYKNFDIDKWFDEYKLFDYENACSIYSEYKSIDEEIYWTLEEYKNIDFKPRDISNYFDLIERLSFLFIFLFPQNKSYYENLNNRLNCAKRKLKDMSVISYTPNKKDSVYLPDSWFITPNGYLYNPGDGGHKGTDLTYNYNELKFNILNNNDLSYIDNSFMGYVNIANNIIKKGYITKGQFKVFLNYISQPAYLDHIDGIPITREKHIVDMTVGAIMAHAFFNKFFDDFIHYVKNPQIELEKLLELTNDILTDVLVRCCGFHKIESEYEKTITTSLINYEDEFKNYIEKGWTIKFVPPIIINKEKECIEEYPNDFLVIRKVLKKDR